MHITTLLVIEIYEISVRANLSGGKFVFVRLDAFFCNSATAVMTIAIIKDKLCNCKPVQGEHFQLLGEDALLHADPQPEQVLHL